MSKPYTPNDCWSQKAQLEGYRARSVYKLKELDERFKLLKPNMTVLDLGAAPGSWLQYAKEKVGSEGKVIGLDLQPIEPIEGVETFQADIINSKELSTALLRYCAEGFDIILSDLAPSTSGIKDIDQWKSIELNQAVLKIAQEFLKENGTCVLKALRGADFDEFLKEVKNAWNNVKTAQVKASRDRSNEIYLVMS